MNTIIDFCGLADEIAALERSLGHVGGAERAEALTRLAWYLRQRDTRRALALADEALPLVEQAPIEPARRTGLLARLTLVRAEACDLLADVDNAAVLSMQAREHFVSIGDATGEGDARLIESRTCVDRGSAALHEAVFAEAAAAFERCGDPIRCAWAQAYLAERAAGSDPDAAVARWDAPLQQAAALGHPAVAAQVAFFWGVVLDAKGDVGGALMHFERSHAACLLAGRVRTAIMVGSNVCDIRAELGDFEMALAWSERIVDLARGAAWPVPTAVSLLQTGSLLRRLGRPAPAGELIREALALVEPLPKSKTAAIGHLELGLRALDEHDAQEALHCFIEAQRRGERSGDGRLVLQAMRGEAQALSRLGRADEAVARIERALAREHTPPERIEALRVFAEIARRHALAPPAGSAAASGAIHHLESALAVAGDAPGGVAIPADLLAELSRDHEAAGDATRALLFERRAVGARESSQSKRVADLATVLQVRHETARARAEATHQEALARSEAARADAQEALANAEAARADAAAAANSAKSAFLANMSHELRSPLSAMLGFARLLARDETLPGSAREDLNVMLRSGEHLYGLINQVLDVSKIEAGHMCVVEQEFDLHALLEEQAELFSVNAQRKGLRLALQVHAQVPRHVRADAGKLRQVLGNLLGNAIKFTAQGGVTLSARAADGRVAFAVVDTGVGVAAQELGQLGAAFVQAEAGRRAAEGTGLGLAISRGLVRLMGGELELASTPGQGTSARFELPVTVLRTPVAQPVAPRRVLRLAPGQPAWRILAVDDREEGRRLLVRLLAPLGFEVREAGDGQQAVDEWRRWRPQLICMDMRMPVMDGLQATRCIKAEARGDAPVILALTASSFEDEREQILAAGCDDFMRKPYREEALYAMLERHLKVRFEHEAHEAQDVAAGGPEVDLQALPQPLRERLQQALQRLNVADIEDAIEDIAAHDAAAAAVLAPLAGGFEYRRIAALLGART